MAASVVGIDIGSQSCFVAVAKSGGVETVDNEYSDRCTPTCISFGSKQRLIGHAAKQQQVTNVKNTVYGFTKLLGLTADDPVVQKEMKSLPYKVVTLDNNKIGIVVNYLGQEKTFTPEQLMAMQLTKLKEVAEKHLAPAKVVDFVLNVPSGYNDTQRRALLDSAQIAGLNCIRLINDTTAVSVAYGIYNRDLPAADKPAKNVVFIDMGASNMQVSVAAFNDGICKILGSACNQQLGGRDFDATLYNYFCVELKKKYKLDVASNTKATLRLLQECEKLKKLMSANSNPLPLNIECFMNDIDVTCQIKRSDFEEMCANHLQAVQATLEEGLASSGLKVGDINAVEIVGGSTRIPAVKALIQKVFGGEIRTTLNADEAVVRGCAFQCAILSPAFRVREFSIHDWSPYTIVLDYVDGKTNKEETLELFERGGKYPRSRQFSLIQRDNFLLRARYADNDSLGRSQVLGEYQVHNIPSMVNKEALPNEKGDGLFDIGVKVRLNLHGIFLLSQIQLCERQEKSVPAPQTQPTAATPSETNAADQKPTENGEADAGEKEKMDVDNGGAAASDQTAPLAQPEQSAAADPPKMVTKVVNTKRDLPVQANIPHDKSSKDINELVEEENKMIMADRLEREREMAKNSVEEYVYDMRDKVSDTLRQFIDDAGYEEYCKQLTATEDWLYDEGEDLNKQAYVDRLDGLRKVGELLKWRSREAELRPQATNQFNNICNAVRQALDAYVNGAEQYNHIDKVDMERVAKELSEKENKFTVEIQKQGKVPPHQDPVFTVDQIMQITKELDNVSRPVLTKPKPKVEPPPPAEDKGKGKKSKSPDPKKAKNNSAANGGDANQEQTEANNNSSDPQQNNSATNNIINDMDID